MSRSKAKETLSMENFEADMQNVFSTCISKNTIDESPAAYKDSNKILDLISETCEVLYVVKPVISIKDTSEAPSWKKNKNSIIQF